MSITDLFNNTRGAGDPVVATVASSRSSGATSLSCDDLTNWPNDTVHFITYQKTAAGGINYDTLQNFKGIVATNTIGTVTLKHSPTGTDLGNSIGDFVEMAPTATWGQDLFDGLAVSHNQDGTLKDGVVTTNKLADGAVEPSKWTNPYKFYAFRTGAWTTASGSYGKVQLNDELFDTNNNFDSTTNFRYTVPVNGFYHFSFGATGPVANGSFFASSLHKNGASAVLGSGAVSSNTFTHGSRGSALLQLTAGDYIELFFRGSGGVGDSGFTNTFLIGYLITLT